MNAAMKRIGSVALLLAVSSAASTSRAGMTVDFRAQPATSSVSSATIDGLIVTAGAGQTLVFGGNRGLAIDGHILIGSVLPGISGAESVRFGFEAGAATGVWFNRFALFHVDGGPDTFDLEGFHADGTSLGTVTYDPRADMTPADPYPRLDVSAAFGDVLLSGFRIAGRGTATALVGTAMSVWNVGFDPVGIAGPAVPDPVAAPEPSTLAGGLLGAALLGIGRWLKRRRRAAD